MLMSIIDDPGLVSIAEEVEASLKKAVDDAR